MKMSNVFTGLMMICSIGFLQSGAQTVVANTNTENAIVIPYKEASYGRAPYTRTYFLPQQTGNFLVALKLKSDKKCKLRVQLGLTGKEYFVDVKPSADYQTLPVGEYKIDSVAYHFIGIQNADRKFTLPNIEAVVLSGNAAKNVRFNNTEYRGAPATHLSYKVPGDSAAAWFYSEISVPKEAEAMHAYYMTNGFNGGYFGIQINSPSERRILFSIWSDYKTDNPAEIPAEYTVKLLRKGENVHGGEFGNEGSGGQTYLRFNWKADTVYKLLVNAKAVGEHTIYTGYFYDPGQSKWVLIGEWDKPKTGGKLLTGLYSFVENFGENGTDLFKANYGNQWIKTSSGNWIELTQARFTTTADPLKHPRFDCGGGVVNSNWFYMFSGGFKQADISKKGDIYTRAPNKNPPVIEQLP